MSTLQVSSAEQELAELSERIAHWRAPRASDQERIPQALWDEAIRVSTRLANARVAKTRRLSPGELKRRRLAQPAPVSTAAVEAHPNLVELTPVGPSPAIANDASAEVAARELQILLCNGHPDQADMAEDWRRVA